MEFTIKRSLWLRGGKNGAGEAQGSELLSKKNGHMCCIGQFGLACGVPKDRLRGAGSPQSIDGGQLPEVFTRALLAVEVGGSMDRFIDRWNNAAAVNLIDINDKDAMSDASRESKITKLFANLGHTVTFID